MIIPAMFYCINKSEKQTNQTTPNLFVQILLYTGLLCLIIYIIKISLHIIYQLWMYISSFMKIYNDIHSSSQYDRLREWLINDLYNNQADCKLTFVIFLICMLLFLCILSVLYFQCKLCIKIFCKIIHKNKQILPL